MGVGWVKRVGVCVGGGITRCQSGKRETTNADSISAPPPVSADHHDGPAPTGIRHHNHGSSSTNGDDDASTADGLCSAAIPATCSAAIPTTYPCTATTTRPCTRTHQYHHFHFHDYNDSSHSCGSCRSASSSSTATRRPTVPRNSSPHPGTNLPRSQHLPARIGHGQAAQVCMRG